MDMCNHAKHIISFYIEADSVNAGLDCKCCSLSKTSFTEAVDDDFSLYIRCSLNWYRRKTTETHKSHEQVK